MRDKTTGKAMAIVMVLAMIATVIAIFPANISAAGAYEVTGEVKDDVTSVGLGGVKVTITNDTLGVEKNTTTSASGHFSLWVDNGTVNYNVTFEKTGYRTKMVELLNTTFNHTSMEADMGVILLEPLPILKGTVMELNSEDTYLMDVEVTIKNGTTGNVIDQIMTDAGGKFSHYAEDPLVDLYYRKDGYYDNMDESVDIPALGVKDIGVVFLEKIIPEPTIKVWGIVFEKGTDQTLEGAIVSLSKGDEKWITSVTNENGYYEMYTYAGNFQVKASLTGYYTDISDDWLEVPSEKRRDIYLNKTPAETLILLGTIDDGAATPVIGADVYLHSDDGQYVNHTTTDGAGAYTMQFYDDDFKLEVRHSDFFTYVHPGFIDNTDDGVPVDISLEAIVQPWSLSGIVIDQETDYPIEGATVTVYDTKKLYSNTTTTGTGGNYEFIVHGGNNLVLIVDAEGYQSNASYINALAADKYFEVGLMPSPKDVIETTYAFVNWTHISVFVNSTIEVDNMSTRGDMDRKYGMGVLGLDLNNWNLAAGEVDDWETYLEQKGLEQRDTSGFLTLDNHYYELAGAYDVEINDAEGNVTTATALISINTTYKYEMVGELDDLNASLFSLVLNASYDTDTLDNKYSIVLPMDPMFEMTSVTTETVYVDVTGNNVPITVDPQEYEDDLETVDMTIERSMNGTAKAKVVDGLHYILNSTYDNYTIIVRMGSADPVNTTVTFSAADSTDVIGSISQANFSWDFNSSGTSNAWGMDASYNFTTTGEQIVNLTITETGGNKTYREIIVKVDSQNPIAGIGVDDSDDNISLSGSTLTVNEDLPLVFTGIGFSDVEGDVIWNGTTSADAESFGLLEKWYWSWGEEGVSNETITMEGSNNITHTYETPGTYTLLMNVTDVVGHTSADRTWTVNVVDITPPEPDIIMENVTGEVVYEAIENQLFFFNASATTDNFDEPQNMSFRWEFEYMGDILANITGLIVNYTFDEVGDYNLTLFATDTALNEINYTLPVHVNIGDRPNLFMLFGTMDFGEGPGVPGKGTAGSTVTISVNITNNGQANATDVTVNFFIREADDTDTPIGSVSGITIAKDGNHTASINWKPSSKGEYSIWANCTTPDEHSSQESDNKIDNFNIQKVTVKEAAWVMPAIIVAVIAVIVVLFFGVRYFMRSRMEAEEGKSGKRKKR